MTLHAEIFEPAGADNSRDILKLVIMAVGGQGGGVLSNWIEAVARSEGRAVQMTSVAGVAQRTGATIYYIEIAPDGARDPVFSLSPAAADVDILIAAELMEAGRAIQRGFVTPNRTTLIASTHRALAVSEKTAPGNGIAKEDEVRAASELAARHLVLADMEALAVRSGSVISASLLGALAGSDALPFARDSYEAAIRASGKGVDASLNAFASGFETARTGPDETETPEPSASDPVVPAGPAALLAEWHRLTDRIAALPAPVQDMVSAGARKAVEFQNTEYGKLYLDRLAQILACETPEHGYAMSIAAAKHIANAMAYDDVIGVADKKTRSARFARIRDEVDATEGKILRVTEFMHPRAEEIIGLMPAKLGARLDASPKWRARIDRVFNRGRRIRSDGLIGFGMLYLLAGLRGYRPRTRRHSVETAHIEDWLENATTTAAQNYDLAVEILQCRRLIKGYSDTHSRGLSKFDRVMGGIDLVRDRSDAASWARRLRDAALQDEDGTALDGALQTVRSFT